MRSTGQYIYDNTIPPSTRSSSSLQLEFFVAPPATPLSASSALISGYIGDNYLERQGQRLLQRLRQWNYLIPDKEEIGIWPWFLWLLFSGSRFCFLPCQFSILRYRFGFSKLVQLQCPSVGFNYSSYSIFVVSWVFRNARLSMIPYDFHPTRCKDIPSSRPGGDFLFAATSSLLRGLDGGEWACLICYRGISVEYGLTDCTCIALGGRESEGLIADFAREFNSNLIPSLTLFCIH